jgi:indolepyruvate ferredoxin oxidoreductase
VTGDFTRDPDLEFPRESLQTLIADTTGRTATDFLDATRLATALLGDSIATNPFMLGYAYQKGLVPLSAAALEKAIELNGVAAEANKRAFLWGRRAAHDLAAVERLVARVAPETVSVPIAHGLEEIVAKRVAFLTDYQNTAYARRYQALIERVRSAEAARAPGMSGLAEAVARYYFKLLAYKDEYEVARLYTDRRFRDALAAQFEGDYRLEFHLSPPLLAPRDPDTGLPVKRRYGPWMLRAFEFLARLKFLRGTAFDIFGRTPERRQERQLIADYESLIDEILAGLSHDKHRLAVALASLPEQIRGYGHIKNEHLVKVRARQAELLAAFRTPSQHQTAAE